MTALKTTRADKSKTRGQSARPEPANLSRRYGDIGIGALAAVLPYATAAKKPAAAQAATRLDERFVEQTT